MYSCFARVNPDRLLEAKERKSQLQLNVRPPAVNPGDDIAAGMIGERQEHTFRFQPEGVKPDGEVTGLEPVTGLALGQLSADGATLHSVVPVGAAVTHDGADYYHTYTVSLTPTMPTFRLTLAVGSVTDLAGNTGPVAPAAAFATGTATGTITDPPPTVITFDSPAAGVIGTPQDHDITFSEAVTGLEVGDFGTSDDVTVNSVTPASGAHTTYTISITPNGVAFDLILAADSVMDTAATPNAGPASPASATGTATPALAFAAGGSPALTSSNADPQRAKEGDTLTLAFEVNVALASDPVVSIAGQDITATKGSGNDYTATYTVLAAQVTDGERVSYSTGTLTAAGAAGNTERINGESGIRIDLTAPVITLNLDAESNINITLMVDDTYNEPGATATDTVDATDPTPTPSGTVDPNTPGDYTITYTATDRAGNVATLTRTVTVSPPIPSSDATLATLTISDGTLNPNFASGTTAYTATVDNDVASLTVTPTATDADKATVTVNGTAVTSETPGVSVDLNVDENNITIEVTAEDTSTQPYTLAVTRAPDTTAPTVDLGTPAAGIINSPQNHNITFSEAVTDLSARDINLMSGSLFVQSVADTGDQTTYTIRFIPFATTFTLALAADAVADLAGNRGPVMAQSVTGTALTAQAVPPALVGPLEGRNYDHPENDTSVVFQFSVLTYASKTIATDGLTFSGANAEQFRGRVAVQLAGANYLARVSFRTAADFEAMASAAGNNVYALTLLVTDSAGAVLTFDVTVTVTDAADPGSVNDITGSAQVGQILTAGDTVTDQDSPETIAITRYQWQRGDASGANNMDIEGETGNTYEVVPADLGATLRVVVSYIDNFGNYIPKSANNPLHP